MFHLHHSITNDFDKWLKSVGRSLKTMGKIGLINHCYACNRTSLRKKSWFTIFYFLTAFACSVTLNWNAILMIKSSPLTWCMYSMNLNLL